MVNPASVTCGCGFALALDFALPAPLGVAALPFAIMVCNVMGG